YLPAALPYHGDGRGSRAEEAIGRGTETILLVEDDEAVRELTLSVLRAYGYRVLAASTGAEGFEVWKQHRNEVRLLLTDMVMPDGMSGLELAKLLRAADPGLKIICMSGYNH